MGSNNFDNAVRRNTSSTLPFTASGTATSIAHGDADIRRRLTVAGRSSPELSSALCMDMFAGCMAGLVSAGPVCIMDKAITQNASGAASLTTSLRRSLSELSPQIVRSPQFRWIWLVYGTTYATANAASSICGENEVSPVVPVLVASTLVNTTTCIAKDRAFAQMFGKGPIRPVPSLCYGLWLVRDIITMGCVFSLPPVIAQRLQGQGLELSERSAALASQLAVPIISQAPATALHLTGLDLYNRGGLSLQQRIAFVQAEFGKTLGARVLRGLVPYCVGAVLNREIRVGSHAALSRPDLGLYDLK